MSKPASIVPALSSTLIRIELLLDRRSNGRRIDLRAVSELVLGDVGATLQILRLAGCEYALPEERPRSIEHCIASFSMETWLRAISAPPFAHDGNYGRAVAFWEHARRIAQQTRSIAESVPGVNPGEAYIVGLLHDLAGLPEVLGWTPQAGNPAGDRASGSALAREWSLPGFVIEALGEQESAYPLFHVQADRAAQRRPEWADVLGAAHRGESGGSTEVAPGFARQEGKFSIRSRTEGVRVFPALRPTGRIHLQAIN